MNVSDLLENLDEMCAEFAIKAIIKGVLKIFYFLDLNLTLSYFPEKEWKTAPEGSRVPVDILWAPMEGLANKNDRIVAQQIFFPERVLKPG